MKQSIYNFFVDTDNGEFIFNSLYNSLAFIDKETAAFLKQGLIEKIPKEEIEALKEARFLVGDNVEEKVIAKVIYEQEKYNNTHCNFTVLTTYDCNLACPYCYEGAGRIIKNVMTNSIVDRVIKFIKRESKENASKEVELVFYGGEPLLNYKSIIKILKSLHDFMEKNEISFFSRIVTNGTLLTEKRIKELQELRCINVQITLHGPQETHDKFRIFKNGKPTYELIMRVLNMLINSKIEPSICVNVDKMNVNKIELLLDDLEKKGFKQIPLTFSPILPIGEAHSYSNLCLTEKEMPFFYNLYYVTRLRGFKIGSRIPKLRRIYCDMLKSGSYTIDPLGDVYKCWNMVGQRIHRIGVIDKNGRLRVEYPYYDIMSRDPLQIKECRNCKLLPMCGGNCIARAYFREGTYHARGCYGELLYINEVIKTVIQTYIES